MFKKKDKQTEEFDEVQTIIGPSIEVKGNFEGRGDVIVEGKLSGTLKTKRDLRVGPEAIVEADIEATNILIAGEIKGSIKASEEMELVSGAKITGDIETKSLIIEKGVIFNGGCVMTTEDGGQKTEDRGREVGAGEEKKKGRGKKNNEDGELKIEDGIEGLNDDKGDRRD